MLARSTLIYGPAIAAPRAAAFVLVLLLTHSLGKAEFGLYALVIVVGEWLDMTGGAWIRLSLLRLDIARPDAWRDGLRRSLALSAGAVVAQVALAAGASAILVPERFAGFALAVSAYAAANGLLRLALTLLQVRDRRAAYSAVEVARSILLLASAALAVAFSDRFETVVLANAAVTGLCAIGCLIYGRRGLAEGEAPAARYRARITYGLPLVAIGLLAYAVSGADRAGLKLILGAGSVGAYAAAYALARAPLDVVGAAINQGGFPELMRRYEAAGASAAAAFLREAFELTSLLALAALGMALALAQPLASATLSVAYREAAARLIPVIALAAMLGILKTFVFDNAFHTLRRNWLQAATYLPVAALTALACWALIPRFGVDGAAWAGVIGAAAGLATSAAYACRKLDLRLSVEELGKALACALAARLAAQLVEIACHGPEMLRLLAGAAAGGGAWIGAVAVFRPRSLASVWRSSPFRHRPAPV